MILSDALFCTFTPNVITEGLGASYFLIDWWIYRRLVHGPECTILKFSTKLVDAQVNDI